MKDISTLISDIYDVVEGKGGWDETVTEFLRDRLTHTLSSIYDDPREHGPYLRMSNIGSPCRRKLWYSINKSEIAEPLPPHVRINFTYGHILEDLVIALVKAAGHTVEGEQDVQEIDGIKGHRDCVIDGMLVDVKSASNSAFFKFQNHELVSNDPFVYLGQLSSYLYSSKDDPLVKEKSKAAFLVINKNNGRLLLDTYDLSKRVDNKLDEVEEVRAIVNDTSVLPDRGYELKAFGKSGNKELPFECSHCAFKTECYPDLRVFSGFRGPVYLAVVKKEPRMDEITP